MTDIKLIVLDKRKLKGKRNWKHPFAIKEKVCPIINSPCLKERCMAWRLGGSCKLMDS